MSFYNFAIAKGDVPHRARVHKFGFNGAVTSTKGTIWAHGGVINWPASASVMKVSSSAAADDAASTGARTMTVQGLDSDWALAEEVVTLDGQTQVTTTTSFVRVFRLIVDTAGNGGTNAGVIYVYTGAATDGVPDTATLIYATIEAGDGQTLIAAYTVPAGHTAYMTYLTASSFGTQNVGMTLDVDARANANQSDSLFVVKDRFLVGRGSFTITMETGLPEFAEMTDIMVSGTSDGTTGDMAAIFDLLLVKA